MQALIDYDGWRKWKDINKTTDAATDKTDKGKEKTKSSKAPAGTVRSKGKRLSQVQDMSSGSGSATGSDGLEGEVSVGVVGGA